MPSHILFLPPPSLQWVLSVDLFANEEADANVVVSETESWTKQGEEVCQG